MDQEERKKEIPLVFSHERNGIIYEFSLTGCTWTVTAVSLETKRKWNIEIIKEYEDEGKKLKVDTVHKIFYLGCQKDSSELKVNIVWPSISDQSVKLTANSILGPISIELKQFKLSREDELELMIIALGKKVEALEHAQANQSIVNVTVHHDNNRRGYKVGDSVITFPVDKKRSDSVLIIQANICVHGESSAELPQYWTYGGTTVYGQTENYAKNDGYGRSVPCMAVIAGHTKTGPQELDLKFKTALPFSIVNPNKSDHSHFADAQTCSVYTVWEFLLPQYK